MKSKTEKILIVDDEPQVRLVLNRYLESGQYECKQMDNGQSALELIAKESFSAMILDIAMPGISGIAVLEKALEIDENLAIIMITGVDDHNTAYRSFEMGAYGYIVKPFHMNEVLFTVSNALLRRELAIENKKYKNNLEESIKEKTYNLENTNQVLQQEIEGKLILEESLRESLAQSHTFSEELNWNKSELQHALEEISGLIATVIDTKDFSARFSNEEIPLCYKVMQCTKEVCPCYGKEGQRCWQIAGTHCKGKVQGSFAKKYLTCSKCIVYRDARKTFRLQVGEEFNNMMHILEQKNSKLVDAYETLQKTQEQIAQQEKMALIGQLAAGIVHEIKSPLSYVTMNLETISEYLESMSDFLLDMPALIKKANSDELQGAFDKLWEDYDVDFIIDDSKPTIKQSGEGCDRIRCIVEDLKRFFHPGGDDETEL